MYKTKVLLALVGISIILAGAGFAFAGQEGSMRERILSRDFQTASNALEENKRDRAAELVRLSLQHPSLLIKSRAAEALKDLYDKDSVLALIETLEQNQVTQRGGHETKALQMKLNNVIVSALQWLTGLSFPVEMTKSEDIPSLKTYSSSDIKQVIQITRKWLAP